MKDWQNNKSLMKISQRQNEHSEEKRDTMCLNEIRDSLILQQSEADGEIKKTFNPLKIGK